MNANSSSDDDERRPKLLIVGASVRAAAESAAATNFDLVAADLFVDRDLRAICDAMQLDAGYAGLEQWVQQTCPDYWMYTGALENYPQIVKTISAGVTLLGNGPAVLNRVRDPNCLARVVQRAGFHFPETIARSESLPVDGRWVVKPYRSAAGIGMAFAQANEPPPSSSYRQRYVEGQSCSGVFLAHSGGAELLGVTQQLTGDSTFGAQGFRYVGSIGPIEIPPEIQRQWQDLGACLAQEFQLLGLFGVDAITTDKTISPIEVNPRYTASVEILERCLDRIAVPLHVRACQGESISGMLPNSNSTRMHGKAIVYSPVDFQVDCAFVEAIETLNADQSRVADLPHANVKVTAGSPLVTVFAEGSKQTEVYRQLSQRAGMIVSLIR